MEAQTQYPRWKLSSVHVFGKFEPQRQCLQYLCMGLQAVGIMVSEEKIFKDICGYFQCAPFPRLQTGKVVWVLSFDL